MEFGLFSLTLILFVHRIHTTPSFTFSRKYKNPKDILDTIVVDGETNRTWNLQGYLSANSTDVQDSQNFVVIHIDNDLACLLYIDACRPSPIPTLGCYCKSRETNRYNLNVTVVAETSQSRGDIFIHWFHYVHDNDTNSYIWEYLGILPPIITQPNFIFENGVTQSRTINVGDIWDVQGSVIIPNASEFYFTSFVEVLKDTETFCLIDISNCPPQKLPTGDIICYCPGKSEDHQEFVYSLNVTATAHKSQSQGNLSVQLDCVRTEGISITGNIGRLPTIRYIPTTTTTTTTQENTSEERSSFLWLILILISCFGGAALLLLICGLIYFTKYKKRKIDMKKQKKEQRNYEIDDSLFCPSEANSKSSDSNARKSSYIDPISNVNIQSDLLKPNTHSSISTKMENNIDPKQIVKH